MKTRGDRTADTATGLAELASSTLASPLLWLARFLNTTTGIAAAGDIEIDEVIDPPENSASAARRAALGGCAWEPSAARGLPRSACNDVEGDARLMLAPRRGSSWRVRLLMCIEVALGKGAHRGRWTNWSATSANQWNGFRGDAISDDQVGPGALAEPGHTRSKLPGIL